MAGIRIINPTIFDSLNVTAKRASQGIAAFVALATYSRSCSPDGLGLASGFGAGTFSGGKAPA